MLSTITTNPLLAAALKYAADGLHVFPVVFGGDDQDKNPLTPHGHRDATTDAKQITKWWTDHPDANIGTWLHKSGLIAVDVDPDHGGDVTFAQLESELGPLPRTNHQRSGSGGEHFIMRDRFCDPDAQVKMPGKLGKGVDIKCNGYVLLEPSRSTKGPYKWITYDLSKLSEIPDAWVPRMEPRATHVDADVSIDAWSESTGPLSQDEEIQLWEKLDTLKRGESNSATFQALKTIFHDYGRSITEGMPYATTWNEICGDPHEPAELERQIERVSVSVAEKFAARDITNARGSSVGLARAFPRLMSGQGIKALSGQAMRTYEATDLGNAERFVDEHRNLIRYVHAWRRWLVWDGTRWRPDDGGAIKRLIHKTVHKMGTDAAALPVRRHVN